MAAGWIEIRHQVVISGRVIDARTGVPLAGARVAITKSPAEFAAWLSVRAIAFGERWEALTERLDRRLTTADGHYHFLDLPNGAYTVTASLPSAGTRYGVVEKTVTVSRKADGSVSIATAELSLPSTAITGKVTVGATPVVMAEVGVSGGERAFTDSKGSYLLSGIETGNRILRVRAQGFAPASQTAKAEQPGILVSIDIALKPI